MLIKFMSMPLINVVNMPPGILDGIVSNAVAKTKKRISVLAVGVNALVVLALVAPVAVIAPALAPLLSSYRTVFRSLR